MCSDSRMRVMQEIRRRAHYIIPPVVGVSAFVYFAYHAIQGDRGLIAYLQLNTEIEQARQTLSEVASVREQLAREVRLLKPNGLDPDMLDERARTMLNVVRPDEVVIFFDSIPTAPTERQASIEKLELATAN